jgi:hypothetical protein
MNYKIGDRVSFEFQGRKEGEIIEVKNELVLIKVPVGTAVWRIWQHTLRLTRCNLNLKELLNELTDELEQEIK